MDRSGLTLCGLSVEILSSIPQFSSEFSNHVQRLRPRRSKKTVQRECLRERERVLESHGRHHFDVGAGRPRVLPGRFSQNQRLRGDRIFGGYGDSWYRPDVCREASQRRLEAENQAMKSGILLFLAVAFACQLVGTLVIQLFYFSKGTWPLFLANCACLASSLPPYLLRFTRFAKQNSSAIPLISVGWRTGVLVCAILLSAATKWPLHFFYCFCLLGCYFPFLLLESALAIVKVQQDSRS